MKINRPSPANQPPIPPSQLTFVAVDRWVMRGQEHIATAVTRSMAHRIARALNLHKPNSRGF